MATRSTIAVLNSNGKVSQIYVHWDGYISYNGRMLKEHYNSLELAQELISHGDMSSLKENINPKGHHTFNDPEDNVCIYYGRDRGELNVKPRIYRDLEVYLRDMQNEEFDYIFDSRDNEWKLVSGGELIGFTLPKQ